MGVLEYLKSSFKRKVARRVTREYPPTIGSFLLEKDGRIDFANWSNPLIKPYKIDQNMVDFFRKFIHPGDLVIDIGANIGDTAVPMALAAGAAGLTLAIDPNPLVFKILEVNASLNKGMQNIQPLCLAISASDDEFYYISSEASFGNGGISKTTNSSHGNYVYPEKIKGVHLKTLLEQDYKDWLPKLSFIKIDTEGYDKEIIKSISDLLENSKPVIVAESFDEATVEDKIELFNVISRHGYDIYYFEDFDITAKVVELKDSEALAAWKSTINIYAVPKKA